MTQLTRVSLPMPTPNTSIYNLVEPILLLLAPPPLLLLRGASISPRISVLPRNELPPPTHPRRHTLTSPPHPSPKPKTSTTHPQITTTYHHFLTYHFPHHVCPHPHLSADNRNLCCTCPPSTQPDLVHGAHVIVGMHCQVKKKVSTFCLL